MPYIDINNVTLYYQVVGEGSPILFLHPPLLSSANFYYQRKELAKQYQVITMDFRGHGKSSSGKETFTYPLIMKDVMALLDHLQLTKVYIAGYSTGGTIALALLKNYPDRFYAGIQISPMVAPTSIYLKSLIWLASALSNQTTISILATAICTSNSDCKETYERLFQEAMKGDPKRIKEYYQYSLTFDYTTSLSVIQQPNLILFGEDDTDFQKDKRILQEKLPNRMIKTIKKVSHQLPTLAAKSLHSCIADFIQYRHNES
ncbi:alpha/beta fold hydrolase [Shimazuella kribbensis]|uniref:alpha/beta fold hydrolase n=1 Tax=Shimazuella kribbensis TaxID=139808 RepID=UPI0004249390|nr:alpha/beta hydrolase [Shimazuella kribbensis]